MTCQCMYPAASAGPGPEQMLCKCQMKEEVMYSRRNEGTFPPPLTVVGALALGASASEVGVSWVPLSRRDLSQGARQRVRVSLGIPAPAKHALRGRRDDLTPWELSHQSPLKLRALPLRPGGSGLFSPQAASRPLASLWDVLAAVDGVLFAKQREQSGSFQRGLALFPWGCWPTRPLKKGTKSQ